MIYLHGFASGPSSKKAEFFREKFKEAGVDISVPDLTQGDFENLTITGQLSVIEREAAGVPVSLIGSSLGGYLAALYAARHEEVTRLVLMAPAFGFARHWPEELGPEKLAHWRSTGYLDIYNYREGRMRRLSYGLLQDGAQYEDYPDALQPTLIFHGRNDTAVPVRYSEEFAATHPNADLQIMDSDHELLNVLDAMWERMRPFLLDV